MKSQDKIKPCPFCGEKMEWKEKGIFGHRSFEKDCPIKYVKFISLEINGWNKRLKD